MCVCSINQRRSKFKREKRKRAYEKTKKTGRQNRTGERERKRERAYAVQTEEGAINIEEREREY